ncbi:MAG: DUF4861 family protein [Phycisphaerae bacterium]|nr:DUF4861 family protein [Phycisphaerae bacterium]
MKSIKRHLFLLLIIVLSLAINAAKAESTKAMPGESYYEVTDDGAWCWFGDPRAVFYQGKHKKTYSGWVNKSGDIQVGSYDHDSQEMHITTLHAKYQRDDHDDPAIHFMPDGRLMIFYSQHGGPDMKMRISKKPEDISEFDTEKNMPFDRARFGICYPNPQRLSDENGRIYMFWRGIDWNPTFSFTDDNGKIWAKNQKLVNSPNARPYTKVDGNGKDKIGIAFTDGHPRNEAKNSIFYMQYKAGALYKADGSKIADLKDCPIERRQADVVYDGTKTNVRAWIWDVAHDEQGYPVLVYAVLPAENDHRYYYSRWDGGKWNTTELYKAGKWFPKTPQGKREPEPHYSGGIILDHDNPSIVYLSRPVNDVFEIEKWTTADNGKTWDSQAITANSKNDNVRPFAIRNHPAKGPTVMWMNNNHYQHYMTFDSSIKMDMPAKSLSTAIDQKAIIKAMTKVADWQIENPGNHNPRDWTWGALLAGMSAWSNMAPEAKYTNWLYELGDKGKWQLYNRKYHADDHTVGQMYLEMYARFKENKMLAPTQKGMDYVLANPSKALLKVGSSGSFDRWCWCDALFMAPPTLAKLASATGDKKYLDFMDKEWWYTTDYLYDTEEHLYFRDSRYFDKKEANGRKVFWGRGNGWVFGGLARVLDCMPEDYPTRPKYIKLYKEMASTIASLQQSDGLWRASMLDPDSYPNPETSSSGFFCYGLAWGINRGLLDTETYMPVVDKAWAGLVKSIHPNGMLGWVQPIGQDPKKVTFDMTEVYGVGAFLLAGSEVHKIAATSAQGILVKVANPIATFRANETIELDYNNLIRKNPTLANGIAVFNYDGNDFVVTQMLDENSDGKADKLLFQADFAPGEIKLFSIIAVNSSFNQPKSQYTTFGRFVPERMDDFAWENDRIAFRMYGPALQATGEISSGVDVWSKSVRFPVINDWYKKADYHRDHGQGLDGYKVGPTCGAGGIAIFKDDKLQYSKNFTSWKILANGPIRTMFELTYAPWNVGDITVNETKRISLDLGSNFNKFQSTFVTDAASLPIAVGIVKRKDAGTSIYNNEQNWMGYWEPTNANNGTTGVAVIMAKGQNAKFTQVDGHLLLLNNVTTKSINYYTGACWDKSEDFDTASDWYDYIVSFSQRVANPLKVSIN